MGFKFFLQISMTSLMDDPKQEKKWSFRKQAETECFFKRFFLVNKIEGSSSKDIFFLIVNEFKLVNYLQL